MYKNKIIFTLVMSTLMVTTAYCQQKLDNGPVKTIKGTVMNTDSVGNTISIRTDNKQDMVNFVPDTDSQQEMVFFVPDKANITQETHNIGLMDIEDSNNVTIRYFVSPTFKNTVVSIVDNKAAVNE